MDKLDIILVLPEDLVSTQETGLETLASILEVKDQTALMKPYCFQEVAVQVITLALQKGQASILEVLEDITQDPRVVGEGRWQATKTGSAHQLCLQMMKTWRKLRFLLK